MKKIAYFSIAMAAWMTLSWLPLRICDFDFKEAVYWQDQQAELTKYFALALCQAVVFAIMCVSKISTNTEKLRAAARFVVGALICSAITLCYYSITLPGCKTPGYRIFLVTAFVSHTLRVFLSAFCYTQFARWLWKLLRPWFRGKLTKAFNGPWRKWI